MTNESWERLEARPAVIPWQRLRRDFVNSVAAAFSQWIAPDQAHFRRQLVVAAGRFDEGARLLSDLLPYAGRRVRVLDIGAGNAGVALAFANDPNHEVFALDLVPNTQAVELRRKISVPFQHIVGDGGALPFRSSSFDIVLLVDVLEHLAAPARVGSEVMRVLRPGGRCIVQTPARAPLLLRRDPHFGIAGLLLFPNDVQRLIVNTVFRRRIRTPTGVSRPAYDVEHIFWHAREVVRAFPGPKAVDVLYDTGFRPPPGRPHWRWLLRPRWILEKLRYDLRHFCFGHIIVHKDAPAPHAPAHDRFFVS